MLASRRAEHTCAALGSFVACRAHWALCANALGYSPAKVKAAIPAFAVCPTRAPLVMV